MADVNNVCQVSNLENVDEVLRLLWGESVKEDIFERWSQGFVFSADEPSALIQEQGGPCAIIASVQAYFLKSMLFVEDTPAPENWRQLTDDQVRHFLVCSLCEMLQNVKTEKFTLVFLRDHLVFTPCMTPERSEREEADEHALSNSPDSQSPVYHKSVCVQELMTLSSEMFHSKLCEVQCCVADDLSQVINKNIAMLEGRFGVLLFLYSILLTKGIESIKSEMEDVGEPLVDINFGHGSQTLINLMLTGHSVSNVWDSTRVLSGLELRGIPRQSSIGFLTLLEAHRYCEVGNFLKSPKFPIWLLGSETHLTVFFSQEQCLTGSESDREKGLRVFKSHDHQDNGFITSDKLGNVLEDLGLVSEPEYVSFMKERLDQDAIGIILLQNFLKEFFPGEDNPEGDVKPFKAFHYNGLGVREADGSKKVVYTEGLASIEPSDFSHIAEQQIVTCLKTKWPGIWLEWSGKNVPSLN
ncbi:ubiquitin carboxyl-terminal hydrolase MINDY-3-like [Montipora foliosa]|uniref:ubiquitin carboxyl-terminal hydrolase MINDY-3-like n=1 Tax=Montipora foliosa TaxID=591990 RepID=UPI0035F1998F